MAPSQVQDADWDEDSFLQMYLTTLARTVIQMQVPVSIHHTWEMLEEYPVEHLPRNSLIEPLAVSSRCSMQTPKLHFRTP